METEEKQGSRLERDGLPASHWELSVSLQIETFPPARRMEAHKTPETKEIYKA